MVLEDISHTGSLGWFKAFGGLNLDGKLYLDSFLEFEVSEINKFPLVLILVNLGFVMFKCVVLWSIIWVERNYGRFLIYWEFSDLIWLWFISLGLIALNDIK